jgi:pyruvate/2-oxoglutarate dehydrogenase complex dihydrolipoamide acyltransferase (E2) component
MAENGMPEIRIVTEVAGRVCELPVEVGRSVRDGEDIVFVEAMKMEIPVASPAAGKLKSILVNLDDVVAEGQVLAIIETWTPAPAHMPHRFLNPSILFRAWRRLRRRRLNSTILFSILLAGTGSRKGNPNPSIGAPHDLAMLRAIRSIDREVKWVGDSEAAFNFKVCAANWDIVDRAFDAGALERDYPGLKDLMTFAVSFFHRHDSFERGKPLLNAFTSKPTRLGKFRIPKLS